MIDMSESEKILFEAKISMIYVAWMKVSEESYKRKQKEKEEQEKFHEAALGRGSLFNDKK